MKQRNGFVSNSSSSSFVVALKQVPQTEAEVKEIFFNNRNEVYEYDFVGPFSTDVLSSILLRDLREKRELLTIEAIAEELNSGWFYGKPDHNWDIPRKQSGESEKEYWDRWNAKWDEENLESLKVAEQIAAKFMDDNPNCHYYLLHYSDEDGGVFCQLEHGDHWNYVPCLVVSHH